MGSGMEDVFVVEVGSMRSTYRYGAREVELCWMGLERVPWQLLHCGWLEVLDLSNNRLTRLEYMPQSLRKFDLSGNRLQRLPGLPGGLQLLNVSWNRLERLPSLPRGLLNLNAAGNRLEQLPSLPRGLQRLEVCEAASELLERLPPYLEGLYVGPGPLAEHPRVQEVNSGRWAAAQRERDRREIIVSFLSCCPLVQWPAVGARPGP